MRIALSPTSNGMRKFNITLLILVIAGFVGFLFLKNNSVVTDDVIDNIEETTLKSYESGFYKFSFEYPDKFIVNDVPMDGGGNKIVVESTESKKGFQITILPFDELGPLTEERIKKDLPDLVILEAVRGDISGVDVLQFKSVDENVGNTFEIWFIYSGNLYQIQTYREFSEELLDILKSWKFK